MLISAHRLKKVLHEILRQAGSDDYEADLVSGEDAGISRARLQSL